MNNNQYTRKALFGFLSKPFRAIADLATGASTKGGNLRKRYAMVMDLDKCIGCNACTVACKAENGIVLGSFRTVVLEKEAGTYPNTKRFFMPLMCNHCEDAPCIPACPNQAVIKTENGIVEIDKDLCKGFQLCVQKCPYGAIYINPETIPGQDSAPSPAQAILKADKCDFCRHRIDEGLEPACSNTCPTQARIFGDMADKNSKVFQMVTKEKLTGVLEEAGTRPQVFYKGGNKGVFDVRKIINKRND